MSPTPAGSGKSARPVPGRTRDTGHRQRLCRAASAGAVKRGARRHPLSEKRRAVARPSPSEFMPLPASFTPQKSPKTPQKPPK
ncbi:arginase [Escherichia coli]|nr:arginase [Escherichia coli]MED0152716.1 arginase [Escherichia coli]MED9524878.1 arginase [Escherichia coli]MED9577515.1 arginase [Escherichia coli]